MPRFMLIARGILIVRSDRFQGLELVEAVVKIFDVAARNLLAQRIVEEGARRAGGGAALASRKVIVTLSLVSVLSYLASSSTRGVP